MSARPTVLIVDDEVRSLETLERILEDDFDIQTAQNVEQARLILQGKWVQIILCDQRMPDMTGVEFLKQVREQWPDVIRMIISGYTDSEDIISAVNEAGIYQFVTKPWHPDSLVLLLKNAAELFELQRKNEVLSVELKMSPSRLQSLMDNKSRRLREDYSCDDQIVRSSQSCMNQVCEKIRRVSPYDISVLLTGESGTGKELAARALHYNSNRWQQPFVVENCGALPDELLESELFGYKRGAFTGAVEDRAGLFERANGGTVFLDEVGEVSPAFQVKLLRVLQEGEIRPLGCSQTRQVDVRIIAATNRDLEQEVREGRFREDLYYRLAAVTIQLPALRDRKMDIPLIANNILEASIKQLGKQVEGFTTETLACMQAYHWPGNVRELQNEIRHMLVMGESDLLGADLLSPRVLRAAPEEDEADMLMMGELQGSLKERVESLEARILKECLIRNRWNKSQAAKEMGLSRVGLRNKLERYGLEKIEQLRDDENMVG
ncbi:MAG: sigma-54 dependent transcriptional regulator [Candidatus Thiodiazotropha sp. DIVDIV]